MLLCWQFRIFDFVKFRKRVPAGLISAWCDWLRQRPQGQHHQDKMLSRSITAILRSRGDQADPDALIYYEPEREPETLPQPQIDANIALFRAMHAKTPAGGRAP